MESSLEWLKNIPRRFAGSAATQARFVLFLIVVLLVGAVGLALPEARTGALMLLGVWCFYLLISLRWALVRLQKHEQDLI